MQFMTLKDATLPPPKNKLNHSNIVQEILVCKYVNPAV